MEVKQYLPNLLRITPIGILVIVCVIAINNVSFTRFFPIRNVRVYGANHISHQEVQELLNPYLSRGFFSINVEYIRDHLLQIPWVSDIFVRRQWPDQVEVMVVEKNAIGRWNGNALLSSAGEVFSPHQTSYPARLPVFIGPDGSQMEMLEYFEAMNRILLPIHAKISYLELTPYATWKLKMDNGILLQIGHKEVLTRLGHFVKVYPKIIGARAADVEYIDLRYSNGLAIRWKDPV